MYRKKPQTSKQKNVKQEQPKQPIGKMWSEGQYEVSNWYEVQGNIEDKYEQKRADILKHPSRILCVGPSGSGKTQLAVNLTIDIFKWDRLYVFAPQSSQFLIKTLIDYVSNEIAELGEEPNDYIHVSDNVDITPEELDPELQHFIIFDDLVSKYESANNKKILQFAKKCRLRNCTMIILTQSYHDCYPEIRENMNVLCLFEIRNMNDKSRILSTWCPDLTKDEFKTIWLQATTKKNSKDLNAFLTIVKDEIDKYRKYRRGLTVGTLYTRNNLLIERPNVSGSYPTSSPIDYFDEY